MQLMLTSNFLMFIPMVFCIVGEGEEAYRKNSR